ncbi:MAG TPA: cation:proton antiporter, partial [Isosphaeraceae bacterium]|nr:cation:proton antiporter [Isosphaeraceae bacterium]
ERRYLEKGHLSVDHVALVLVGVLLSALTTEKIGIHAIFGAFVFGAVMPKGSGMARELTEKIEDFTVVVLLPVFFAVTGLRTNLFALNNVSLLGWLLLILATATAGKFVGTGLAARLTGSSRKDAVIIGALMNTRGLTELVILSIGLSLGVLSDRTFAMMVIMALATTVMAAPIVNRLVSRDDLVADLIGAGHEATRPSARVLVAIGNPLNAPHLVDAAVRMTGGRRPAELLLVRLIPTPRAPEFHTGLLEVESQVAAAVDSMRPLVEQAAAAGVLARPISFLSDHVGPDLARIAADQHCDAILLGWHRASLARHVVQALVLRTFELSPCDVAVLVDREGRGIPTGTDRPVVVVLTDPTGEPSATRLGVDLAASLSAPLRLVGNVDGRINRPGPAASEALAHRADELRRESGLWVVPVYADGDGAALALSELAGASVAVVPVGPDWATTRDFGRPTEALAEAASCPLLVVRPAPAARPPSAGGAAHHGARPATV